MKTIRKTAFSAIVLALAALSSQALADVTLTLTPNTTLGGTNFAFSQGSGTIRDNAFSDFLVGEDASKPLGYSKGQFQYDGSLTVLAGVNRFQIQNIFSFTYGGLAGTNGPINNGFDFQGGGEWSGGAISDFNGLVLNANGIAYELFNLGTYILPSYYTGYNVDLGTFTLKIGEAANPVPEPGSIAVIGLGFAGLAFLRRHKRHA